MAEIKSGDVARFLKNLPRSYFTFLICGSDTGLVAERTKQIVATLTGSVDDPFGLVRLDGDAIAQDSKLLADEALTIGLFGGQRIVWITVGAKNFVPALEALLLLHPPGCKLVIEAGPLKTDSALRRLCIKSSNVAVVECWPDSVQVITSLIEEEMRASSLAITADALDLLTNLLGDDRLLSRSEIGKLKTYSYGQQSVTEHEILAVVADASSTDFDQAITAAFDGNRAFVLAIVRRIVLDLDCGTLLGLALGHAIMLHQLRLEIEAGKSIEESIERTPRLFGKRKTVVLQHLRIWNSTALLSQANRLSESVLHLRREPKLGDELVMRSLLGVAYGAPRSGLK